MSLSQALLEWEEALTAMQASQQSTGCDLFRVSLQVLGARSEREL